MEAHVDDEGFAACIEEAGASLDGADGWSVGEERDFLARPGVLDCVAGELGAQARTDVLGRAFGSDADPDDGDWAANRQAKRQALVDYVQGQPSEVEEQRVVQRVARLMSGFGWDSAFWYTPRRQVAFALVRERSGAEAFETWLDDHPLPDEPATWADYLEAQPTSPLTRQTDQVERAIVEAQDAAG